MAAEKKGGGPTGFSLFPPGEPLDAVKAISPRAGFCGYPARLSTFRPGANINEKLRQERTATPLSGLPLKNSVRQAVQANVEARMDKEKKQALQATKEIIVKFIETGRVSPSNFQDIFPAVYSDILKTITSEPGSEPEPGDKASE